MVSSSKKRRQQRSRANRRACLAAVKAGKMPLALKHESGLYRLFGDPEWYVEVEQQQLFGQPLQPSVGLRCWDKSKDTTIFLRQATPDEAFAVLATYWPVYVLDWSFFTQKNPPILMSTVGNPTDWDFEAPDWVNIKLGRKKQPVDQSDDLPF